MNDTQRMIEQALSLRQPQKDSLDILAKVLEKIELSKDMSIEEALCLIQEVRPSVKDFERVFPCICFAIATGVGKTRLMGAMIAYLHAEYGIKNFMVLAPNLTIYNKLKTDFTPNTPKYVFPGLNAYVGTPQIITGDDYDQVGGLFDNPNDDRLRINIFNISKIDSDKDSRGTPRVRRMAEYLGQSYFDYLSGLKDLVLIMDEAHRYRANAGMAAINELHPVFGIELTATAKSTGAKGKPFKNIAYEYNLAHAITDGFVKKPAIVGRTDFDKNQYDDDMLEELKMKDGIKVHESVKAELQVYADNNKTRLVKPFMMVIAKDIKHAEDIEAKIKSDDFEEGRYKDKVIVVNSKQNGELKDEVLQRLLQIENADEPTEIVIHVNMLGEGWDVNNLYTIVPLRTADSKILVEQSIGRGLRLPYGELTGDKAIDRLHVVNHDKFEDIIKAARNQSFEFQQEYIDESENGLIGKVAVTSTSKIDELIQTGGIVVAKSQPEQTNLPVFTNENNQKIGDAVREAIAERSRYVSSPEELKNKENQEKIAEATRQKLKNIDLENAELSLEPLVDVEKTVENLTESFIKLTINIPRIIQTYRQLGSFTFKDFDIDTSDFNDYKPESQRMIIQEIIGHHREERQADFFDKYEDITHYLLVPLVEEQIISYQDNADLIHKLVTQTIEHINSYSGSDENTRKILFFNDKDIAHKIMLQMKAHVQVAPMDLDIKVDTDYGSQTSESYKLLTTIDQEILDYRASVKDKSKIKNMVFNGFKKCLFDKQKFDSCTEKDLCEILENSNLVTKWFKVNGDRAKDIFKIKYPDDDHQLHNYLPDFIVETVSDKYMIETKASNQMTEKTVLAKKDAALKWCEIATEFEKKHNGKTWHYLLIPDNTVTLDRTFDKLVRDYEAK
ncbi:MAG: DEAD/DEAH box helicase family protein [Alphaproteobacteria bacterium]|nr:DEAD/DEAH box helicase family protein [Alphaproteobacteria bacterium]